MRDFTKRSRRADIVRRFLFGSGVILLLLLVTFGAVRGALGMYGKFAEATTANDAAQQNLAQLKAQEASVRTEVQNLSSPVGQEAQLRQSYGVAKPGEGEIQIVRQAPTSTTANSSKSGNFFIRMIRALFAW